MVRLPRLLPVVQNFPSRALVDVAAAVRDELGLKKVGAELRPGSRVAIAAGSRGIANLSTIIRATVGHFRDKGHIPFVIPAMGSHGAATAQGQADVLAHYGVTESEVGCPIVSSLDVVQLSRTPEGIDTFMDREGFQSDGIFLVNRIKWHTSFDAPIESGLMKMAAVGLGKLAGAAVYHQHGVRFGLGNVIVSVGRQVLASGKILGGLGLLEDARHDTAKVVAVGADRLEEEEQQLLSQVKTWMPRILFDEVDILIVEEIGKHISGVGMDSKVVNRHPYGATNPWSWAPRILRIYVRDISPLSYGNANGVGMADVISERLHNGIDWNATKVNGLTASNLASLRTPLRAGSDYEAIQILSGTVGRLDPSDVTAVWIRNTLELTRIVATENLLETAGGRKDIEIAGGPSDWEFDASGNFLGGFDRVAGILSAVH